MKSKRQTVWLVSMLSLMVVLSAYYLFTGDSRPVNQTADGQQVSTMDNGSNALVTESGGAMTEDDGVVLTEVISEEGGNAVVTEENTEAEGMTNDTENKENAENAGTENPSNVEQTEESEAGHILDEDVLKQLETQGISAADSIRSYQFQRSEQNNQKQDQLIETINDNSKTMDEAVIAQKELSELQQKEEIIYGIEEKLQQKYADAVVAEADDKYKVLVISEKLEAKEAVNIMDMVIKELGVSQDKVSVQYITQ